MIVVETDFAASDGQKRSVYIYRFLTAGTIDGRSDRLVEGQYLIPMLNLEKIYQRQTTKLGLSSSMSLIIPRLVGLTFLGHSVDWRCENSPITVYPLGSDRL